MEKFLQIIHLKPRSLFGISIVGILLLFNPYGILISFGLENIVDEYRGLIGFITLVTIVFFVIELIPWIKNKYFIHSYNKQVLSYLESLSQDESFMLLYCKKNNMRSLSLSLTNSIANSLVSKGILEQAGGTGNMTAWTYTVSDVVWNKITKNEHILPTISDEDLKRYEEYMYNEF